LIVTKNFALLFSAALKQIRNPQLRFAAACPRISPLTRLHRLTSIALRHSRDSGFHPPRSPDSLVMTTFLPFRRRASRRAAVLALAVSVIAAALACGGCSRGRQLFSRWTSKPVDFSRDIRPILNQNCSSCHGGVRQKGGVSFAFREDALGIGKSGNRTVVPGDPDGSELIRRITSQDPETRMPYHGAALPAEQVALLRRWIAQGANWSDYWAFVPPRPQPLPMVKNKKWARGALDQFILARLERESVQPSPEAEKSALLRRASLDLTGLPPTEAEMSAFLADHSPDAYEKQVDRLLASPAYGERWAALWLDLARYADSYGYEADRIRKGVWVYRDWVIDAYNRNLPYDDFVTRQLAGDLLPNATFEDRIATSFHRQTPNNQEGGTDDEEFRLVAVMDRVATTWSVLNGLTMNCVQCHSHPYDPIRHAEYYKSLAFFNTSNDADRDDDFPTLKVPKDKKKYAETVQLQTEIESLLRSTAAADRQAVESGAWQAAVVQTGDADEIPALRAVLPMAEKYLEKVKKEKAPPATKKDDIVGAIEGIHRLKISLAAAIARGRPAEPFQFRDGEAFAGAETPSKSIYELRVPAGQSVTAIRVEVPPVDAAKARHSPEDGFVVDDLKAFLVRPDGSKQPIAFAGLLFDSTEDLESSVTPVMPDPKAKIKTAPKPPKEIGFSSVPKLFRTRWVVAVPGQALHPVAGDRMEIALKQTGEIDSRPVPIKRLRISVSVDPRFTARLQDSDRRKAAARLFDLKAQLAKIKTVDVPVMSEERPHERRATLEFERGSFLTKTGPELAPGVPEIFPKIAGVTPKDRLSLAKWFFSPGQPLTARVAVNRYWEQLFGTGLVETLENFGSVGEAPSHPELLDWLALHFENDLHWDMKALLREMVTSATYRQRAVSTPELEKRDPRNRLLARGPQQRLTAEMVRDQALVASGLLDRTMGGPPVMPPQPAGVWNSVYSIEKWKDAKGPDRYRRAIYTFVKRTSGYPSFLIFDSSDRVTSLPRRIPTNTPLQALVTLNDPVYDEAAAALAARTMKQTSTRTSGMPVDDRLRYEARLVLSREPSEKELGVLRDLFKQTKGPSGGSLLTPASFHPSQNSAGSAADARKDFEAFKTVASVLLNLDAAMTR
jgi:hypothetical protein